MNQYVIVLLEFRLFFEEKRNEKSIKIFYIIFVYYFRIHEVRVKKDFPNKIKPFIFGKISKIHTISLSKFDLNKPETLAAFGNLNQETESDWGSDELSPISSIVEEDEEEEDVFLLDPVPAKK